MDRFSAMQIYVRVAELSSFTKAAEGLGLPKATLSNTIQKLEAQMGTRLLQRTTRRVQMTQDGQIFYDRCKDLLADVDELESLFQRGAEHVNGRIRIDMPSGVARNILVPSLPEFLEEFPNVELELSCTDRRVDLIREGFDCVIRVGTLTDSGLMARPLGQFTLINCASPKYLKRFGLPKNLEDLSTHHLIHYVSTLGAKPEGFEYHDGEKYRSQRVGGRVIVNNADAYLSGCLAGLGIIQVPLVAVKRHLADGGLKEVLPALRAEPMPVSLIYPHRRHLAKRVQLFMAWVERVMKNYVE